MTSWKSLPFSYKGNANLQIELEKWIKEVFYFIFPSKGLEIRKEQVQTALQICRAFFCNEIIFAEAGLGTGKTISYLLGAIIMARFTQRPVIIACGSNALVEQLMSKNGDISKLNNILGINIDARAALDPTQYLCIKKLLKSMQDQPLREEIKYLVEWAGNTKQGVRLEIPDISDEVWDLVGWEESLECGQCNVKYRCPVLRARENYRQAQDLIICTHSLFFRHIKIKEKQIEEGQIPLLPKYSSIVFDEAHIVAEVARRSLGKKIDLNKLVRLLEIIETEESDLSICRMVQIAKDKTFLLIEKLVQGNVDDINLREIQIEALPNINSLQLIMSNIIKDLAIIEGMRINETMDRRWLWANLCQIESNLRLVYENSNNTNNIIQWVETTKENGISIWSAPFNIAEVMKGEVYSEAKPIIFSSATLANGNSFDYIKMILGVEEAIISKVSSPYNYDKQCIVLFSEKQLNNMKELVDRIVELLKVTGGKSLVLCNKLETMNAIRKIIDNQMGMEHSLNFLWEGDMSNKKLLDVFTEDVSSVLFGVSFWEGISVPGPSLSQCILVELPYPQDDPIIKAKRNMMSQKGEDPFKTIDIPEMITRLRQGTGRLIRSNTDFGIISCLDISFQGTSFESNVLSAFPQGAQTTHEMDKVKLFWENRPNR